MPYWNGWNGSRVLRDTANTSRQGSVRYGVVGRGAAWLRGRGPALRGAARLGKAWLEQGGFGELWRERPSSARRGSERRGGQGGVRCVPIQY